MSGGMEPSYVWDGASLDGPSPLHEAPIKSERPSRQIQFGFALDGRTKKSFTAPSQHPELNREELEGQQTHGIRKFKRIADGNVWENGA